LAYTSKSALVGECEAPSMYQWSAMCTGEKMAGMAHDAEMARPIVSATIEWHRGLLDWLGPSDLGPPLRPTLICRRSLHRSGAVHR
jgi:hypothetical protein